MQIYLDIRESLLQSLLYLITLQFELFDYNIV